MRARDFRRLAWTHLHGNWGTMALCTLIYSLIIGACAALAIFFVGGLAAILLGGAFLLGLAVLVLTTARGVAPRIEQLFDGFRNYASALALSLLIWIFTFLWTLLFFIPGIIMSYAYSMSWFILADDPNIPANEARKRSIEMMRGNKWRLFCLDFSFIGWILLSILTFGILLFWIMPYMQTARAEFYQDLLAQEYAAREAMNASQAAQAEPEQAEPEQAEPEQAESEQAESEQAESEQAESAANETETDEEPHND